ncbi:uncharacterized protein Tco025E_01507 [Trypanosoma conorhini]|uniref:Uncharacterized protein n=1 Tax=Trypanosoma conorhini TaxID=83891 RepID=A0A3R7PJH0_9TRYP|nr:uncharacterized protein Tco025E_01507 [Trypanosoma conorhini]RNF26233.1 hypothetical protein Tco025E_01507 [Trypanosoma conorhini]
MSTHEEYEDDFELSTDGSPPDHKISPPPSSKSPQVPQSSLEGLKAGLQPKTSRQASSGLDGKRHASSSAASGGGRPPQLIRPPEPRTALATPPSTSDGSHFLHVSKLTSVVQMEPERGVAQHFGYRAVDDETVNSLAASVSSLHDPYSGTAGPAEARRHVMDPAASSVKYASASSSSTSSASPGRHAAHPAAAAASEAQATKPPSNAERRISGSEANRGQARRGRNPGSVSSDNGKKAPRSVDVWKRHEVTPLRKTSKTSHAGEASPARRRQKPSHPVRNSSHTREETSPTSDPKGVLWRSIESAHDKSNIHSEEGEFISETEDASRSLRREQLLQTLAKTKDELASVRRARRALEMPSRASQRSSRKGKPRWARMDLDRLERENEHLQRILDLRSVWGGSIDLPLRIAEEELKHVLDELNRVKRRRRDLWTEDRRSSILFTQIVKDQQPTREKVARQYREGMYNRLTLQMKVEGLQEKIAATQETSCRLAKQVRQLEESMQAEGLTQMKPEEYIAMQQDVEKNAVKIDRLVTSVTTMSGKSEYQSFSGTHGTNEDTSNVRFPGRGQMETLLLKLIRQVEQKEARIKSLRQSFARTGSTVPKSKGSLAKFAARKQSLTGSRTGSSMSRLSSNSILHKDGPLAPRRTDVKAAAHSVPPSKSESVRLQQEKEKVERVKRTIPPPGADGRRVIASKLPASSLVKLDGSLSELSENHKGGSALFPVCASPTNSSRASEFSPKTVDNNVKKHPALNDETKSKMTASPHSGSELHSSHSPFQGSPTQFSPNSLGKSGSSRVVAISDGRPSNEVGKEEVADAAQEAREGAAKTPIWLDEY